MKAMSSLTIYGRWLVKYGKLEFFRDNEGRSCEGYSVPEHLNEQETRARELSTRKIIRRMHNP